MTSISSYQLYQCPSCEQKHILPIYGTINFMHPPPPLPKPENIRVCQSCAKAGALSTFTKLGVLPKPRTDNVPKLLRPIYKFLNKDYKGPTPHPMQLYPELRGEAFDDNAYFDNFTKDYYEKNGYPLWFKELSKSQSS